MSAATVLTDRLACDKTDDWVHTPTVTGVAMDSPARDVLFRMEDRLNNVARTLRVVVRFFEDGMLMTGDGPCPGRLF